MSFPLARRVIAPLAIIAPLLAVTSLPAAAGCAYVKNGECMGSTTHVYKDGRKKISPQLKESIGQLNKIDLSGLENLPKKKPKADLSGTNFDINLDGIPPCGGRALLKC